MVPSWIGISYCLPVRLSVIVSVSAMRHLVGYVGRRVVVTVVVDGIVGGASSAAGCPGTR